MCMKNYKQNIAKNLIELRKMNKLTQAELAEKLNYSDKAISKWEHGESLPDVEILCQIAEMYNVSLDYLISDDHEEKTNEYKISVERTNNNKLIITWVSVFSAILLACLSYVFTLNLTHKSIWMIFIWMVPLCFLVLLVFNCIWGKKLFRYIFISLLMWTLFASFALEFRMYKYIWFIFILGVPGEVIILLSSRFGTIKKVARESDRNSNINEKDED